MSYTNSSICDTAGNLLFFSNGCGIMDSNFEFVPGAEFINQGTYQEYLCEEIGGGRRPNAMLILPGYEGQTFNVIHSRTTDQTTVGSAQDKLFWTQIIKNTTNNLEAIFADSLILDTLVYGGSMATCRHGDGKGWWVVVPKHISNVYYVLHIGEKSIDIHLDTIGITTDDFEDSTGEAAFSPGGSKYARYSIDADLQIFDFDRCSGHFSNPIHIPIHDISDTIWAAGLAFSPSGRFLYASSSNYIYQFDMQAPDIGVSVITVAVYDGYWVDGFEVRFFQCELAPDGKIYVGCPGGKRTIHVIENPDEQGISCNVTQHKYILDYPIFGGLPNFPNFRLGPLPDSICPKPPEAIFTCIVDTLQPLQITFTDQSLHQPLAWLWDFGDGATSTEQHPVHAYAGSGVYTVCLEATNDIGTDSVCKVLDFTSAVGQAGEVAGISVFPNPAGEVLFLKGLSTPHCQFRLFDNTGRPVLEAEAVSTSGISIGQLRGGLYFWEIAEMTGKQKAVGKVAVKGF